MSLSRIALLLWAGVLSAQVGTRLASLKTVPVPAFTGAEKYVQDNQALIALGKVLFWDAQAGSDGRTACATCHFHAGADHRRQNQLAGQGAAVNRTLTLDDFPFRKLSNPNDNRSAVVSDKRQQAGSAGVVERAFLDAVMGVAAEDSEDGKTASGFSLAGVHVRQVTTRNTPTVINTVFNVRNFWDGRARTLFTGLTPFGESDQGLNAWVLRDGEWVSEAVRVDNSSLASQANGPALNEVEMSYAGRTWEKLAAKLLSLPPLARQRVAADDSVLGAMANPDGNGLRAEFTYPALIEKAFRPEYQTGRNFPLFWGLALQAYQATLISDDSRLDQFFDGRRDALSALEMRGMQVFNSGNAECADCHGGAELTAASFSNAQRNTTDPRRAGFFRVGVTPIAEDGGLGGVDGFGIPLFGAAAANGTFKAPGLRNVELTGPYFHNGGQATLEQVVDFYGRNGDFPGDGNMAPEIARIRMSADDRTAVVAFLKALTDERVRFQRAPFDHPSLCIPTGHAETAPGVLERDESAQGQVARDKWALIPVVGRGGLSVPLQTFEELLRGIGNDGSRAHTLTDTCEP